ncbi:futalosine hydrolase [Paenibacillus sp. cl6col]|nr:futalosine hydrolase [Paenibacillus sp. cl6col]
MMKEMKDASAAVSTVISAAEAAEQPTEGRILIVTSVAAERDAVLRGLQHHPQYDVILGGVGVAAAAARTARKLANEGSSNYRLVICAGIGGGFPGQAEIGSLVVASDIIAADLGAETPEGFSSLDELGFGSARIPVDAGLVAQVATALQAANLPARSGPVLTVATVTGTAATAAQMAERVPGAAVEAMEGYGVATAAQDFGLPVLELRAISNAVGPRNRAAWRIQEALDALEAASAVLVEVL